jgi:hypothetical protein
MKNHVNLLPMNFRRRCLARRRLRQWSIAWAVVATALLGGWLAERSRWQAALEDAESHEQRYDEVRALRGEIARLTAQKKGLGNQQALVGQLQQSPPPLLAVALVSASAGKCQGRVAVRRLVYNEESPPSPTASQPVGAPPAPPAKIAERRSESARLTLEGIGVDNVAIAEFIVGLRESGAFERVELKSAAAGVTRAGSVTAYKVECGL